MATNHWSAFWKKPNNAFDRVMKVSTDFFHSELGKRFPVAPNSSVLDYGCGPGFLIDNLVRENVAVTGADINEHFINKNRARFPGARFILISEDPAVTFKTLSDKLGPASFDQIILLSIVQYFRSKEEVEDVVRFLTRYLKPAGQLIIADVIQENTSSARDAIGIFIQCARRGRVVAFVKFIAHLMLSDYRNVSRENKMLLLSSDFVKQMADRCSLSVTEEKGMTPHPTRTNFIFTHKK